MDIKSIYKEKRKLEQEIMCLMESFEATTSLQINDVVLTRSFSIGADYPEISSVSLEVGLAQ